MNQETLISEEERIPMNLELDDGEMNADNE
jgi:hypothetical protein